MKKKNNNTPKRPERNLGLPFSFNYLNCFQNGKEINMRIKGLRHLKLTAQS
jgi:hypothetical protein